MKILLAVDGSPCSDAAVQEVCSRPWPDGTEVHVLTVDVPIEEPIRAGLSNSVFDELVLNLRSEANRHIEQAVHTIQSQAPQLAISTCLREGRPKQEILDEIEKWGADLVVIGSNGHGTLGGLLLGSVSLAVAGQAPCNVLIVRSQASRKAAPPEGAA
jgi:nucleotide-binding universal stress UspA family protein